MMNLQRYLLLNSLIFMTLICDGQTLKDQTVSKIEDFKLLIEQARTRGIDVKREESTLWFAKAYLTYADWDANNIGINEMLFGKYGPYKSQKTQLANDLPDLERQGVLDMLISASAELKEVLADGIARRPVPDVDWENITISGDSILSNGNFVFLYDYFSKTPDLAVGSADLYNDYLGSIYHPTSISPAYCTDDFSIRSWHLNNHLNLEDKCVGYSMLWHFPLPAWVKSIEPEVEKGKSIFIGYDIDNPTMFAVWDTVLYHVGKNVIDKKFNQLGFCLINEPHWFSEDGHWSASSGEMESISSYTLSKFKKWLSTKHNGDISNLNALWGKNFASFDDVQIIIPIDKAQRGTPEYYDWCRFNMDRGTVWIASLREKIKKGYPDARTHCKIMPSLFVEDERHHGIDLEAITELTEFIGDDAAARKRDNFLFGPEDWEDYYAYYWKEIALSYDFMESVSPHKPHINSEVHFLSTSHYRDLLMEPKYVRNCYWLATLHGMDIGLTWLWSRRPDGQIEDAVIDGGGGRDGGYPGSVNQQPQVANELTRTMMDLNAFSDEIYHLRILRKPLRIFYSETSAINQSTQMLDLFELYESLYFNGLPIGFATEKIIKKQDNSKWDAVVVYKTPFVTDKEFNALQEYLNDGGTVIIDDGRSLIKNEYGQLRSETLSQGQGLLLKMGSDASYLQIKNKALQVAADKGSMAQVKLKESNGLSKPGCMWRVMPSGGDEYIMTIVNLGKNVATLSPVLSNSNQSIHCVDMLTGKELGSKFQLQSEGVLLVKVKEGYVDVSIQDAKIEKQKPIVTSDVNSITIMNAQDKRVQIVDIYGRILVNTKIASGSETFFSPKGVMLVNVEGDGAIKRIVR